jgi:hypothetical protein
MVEDSLPYLSDIRRESSNTAMPGNDVGSEG